MGIDITSYLLGKQAGGGGGDEPTGTVEITSNGSHNVKQYATASVSVPNSYSASDEGKVVDDGALVAQTSVTKTANGTYDTTLNNEVVVAVPTPSGSISITQNGTVDVTNYASANVNVSSNILFPDYAMLGGQSNDYIVLPYTISADYMITVDFDATYYYSNQAVIGNSYGAKYVHLTQYNNKWYTTSGAYETSFVAPTTGRHLFIVNKDGHCYFDGEIVTDYTPTDYNAPLWVAARNSANGRFGGKLYSYKIESISTGEKICELVPFKVVYKNTVLMGGMFDTVSETFYPTANATAGYDE